MIKKEEQEQIYKGLKPLLDRLEKKANLFINKKPYWTFSIYEMSKSKEVHTYFVEPEKMTDCNIIDTKVYDNLDDADFAFKAELLSNLYDVWLNAFTHFAKTFSNINTELLTTLAKAERGDKLAISQSIGYQGIIWSTAINVDDMSDTTKEFETEEEILKYVKETYPEYKIWERGIE